MSAAVWRNKRVRTPTIIQMEALECGAAALGIILAHYGRWVPLERLRVECGVNRDGSKASNMLSAARGYGMQAAGYRLEPEELKEYPLPLILFWNFNHFLVLEGIKGRKVFINDPACGPRTVSLEEFDKSFTGVALSLVPGPEFEKGGAKPNAIESVRKRLSIGKIGILFAIIAGLGLVIPGLLIPIFSKVFVDEILVDGRQDWFRPLILGMVLTAILRGILTWLQNQALLKQKTKLAVISSAKFLDHVLRLPLNFFTQRSSGEISNRVGLNDTVAELLSGHLATVFISLFTAAFFAALMLVYDPLLTAIGVVFASIDLIVLKWVNRKRSDLRQLVLQEEGKLAGASTAGLRLIESLKSSSSEDDFFARWAGHEAKYRNSLQQMERWTNLITPVPLLVSACSTVAILGIGAYKVMDGQLTVGMLVAFQSLMVSFITPFNGIVQMGAELQTLQGEMNRLDDVMEHERAPGLSEEAARREQGQAPRLTGQVEIRDLTFGYSTYAPPLIDGLSLTLTPGSRVALVGASGSGKSTVGRLVCGLYQPWSGEILLDGAPLPEIPRETLIKSVSYVDQSIVLFAGTVRDNLSLFNPVTSDDKIMRAAKDACIHEAIASRPAGYSSLLEENGSNLSGGQRQRLEIARALVSEPSFLVLDEATSALDASTEQEVDGNLRRRGCTCLIVAHRLSTIRDCDEIVVLDKGRVVQRGRHEEMIEQDGPYRRLIET